jgi:hypothetical protein
VIDWRDWSPPVLLNRSEKEFKEFKESQEFKEFLRRLGLV